MKIYRQVTHTNAPAASSMHHAGVAVHPHYSVVGCGSSPCFQPVLTVVVVLKQPSLIIHTSRDLLQQSVLVDYCCFHLASGASTALGSYIGHRNKRRLLSTLREVFAEKKYQVYNRPSTHSKPSEPLIPGGASIKVMEFWQQTTTTWCGVCL